MKRVLIVSRVFFDDQQEEESNLAVIVKTKIYLESQGYAVIDIKSMLIEASERMSPCIEGAVMAVSSSAYRSFLCLSFIQGCLANSNLLYVCDNSETCPIALILVGMARVMGVGLLYHNEARVLTEELVSEIFLPYVSYQEADTAESTADDYHDYESQSDEIKQRPQSAEERRLQEWFDRDFPNS